MQGWQKVLAVALTCTWPLWAMAGDRGEGHGWERDHGWGPQKHEKRDRRDHDRDDRGHKRDGKPHAAGAAQLGPRPFWLVDNMDDSRLKRELQACAEKREHYKTSDFSIGHRGAPLQFPEHTKESYEAAARMGAGIVECDVTFTRDKELVCRHSQCDLHTTTNILATPLAAKCSVPFQPAVLGADGAVVQPAQARCCTSDITLAEFRTLEGKMDAADASATTVEGYMAGTADWRTDLYEGQATLLTHRESIRLFRKLGVKMTPELKSASVPLPYQGLTQAGYAQKMIDEYREERVRPRDVYAQSFNLDDVLYWINRNPDFGRQAVWLDGRYEDSAFDHRDPATWNPSMEELAASGLQIIAPPMWVLLENDNGRSVPSIYARAARRAGLDIITWTFERDGPLNNGGGFYFQTLNGQNQNAIDPQPGIINNDGDMMDALDTLARDVGIIGIFSDWPATTTFYANCTGQR